MAFTFGFYLDPALTTPVNQRLSFVQADAAPVPAEKVVWFGSPDVSVSCASVSGPGIAPMMVSVVDSTLGSGSPASDVKLALSAAELSAAIGGTALSLPSALFGGVENAIEIHIRVTDSTHAAGVRNDLSLTTNPLVQT